jgi:hypothetical protein
VAVEVKADLTKLVADFARGRRESQAFANDVQRIAAPTKQVTLAQQELSKQIDRMIRQYQPLTALRSRYAQETAVLNQAEQAGLVTSSESAALQRDMAKAMENTTLRMGEQRLGLYGWARETEHHLRAFRLLLSFVGVDLAARLGEFAVKTLETTAAIKDQAAQLGLTTAQLQEYRAVAPDVGMAATDMDKAFAGLDNTLGEISLHGKTTQAAKLFKALDVSITDTAGHIKSRDAIFKQLIDRLGQVGDQAQRRSAAMLIFGEAGSKMGQLIDKGSAGLDKLREAVRQTGAVLSDRQIQDADEAAKKLEMVKTVLSAEIASTVSNNAQAITGLAGALAQLTSALLGFLNSNPQAALGFLGALGGAFLGGPWGAGAGFVGGVLAGDQMQNAQISQNTERRRARLESARQNVARLEGQPQPGDTSVLGLFTIHHSHGASAGTLKDAKAEYARLQAEDKAATAAEAAAAEKPKPKGPNIDLSGVLAPKGPKAKQPKFDTFQQEMAKELQQQLQIAHDATTDIDEQNRLEKEIINQKTVEREQQIDRQIKNHELTQAEGKKLKAEVEITADKEKEAADQKMRLATIQAAAQFADELAGLEQDGLNTARALARTDKDRKEADRLILESKQQQAVWALQTQIAAANEQHNAQRVAELTEELVKLRANQLSEWKQFDIDHLNAMQQFQRNLPATGEEFNDQTKNLAFEQFNQKLQQAAQFAGDTGDAFGKFAGELAQFKNPLTAFRTLISDLAATFTKNFVEKPVSDWVKDHLGTPLAKQAFGSQLDKLAKEAGGTALTTTQMNTALATATQSLYLLTHAAEAAASAVGAQSGGTGSFSGSSIAGLFGGGGSSSLGSLFGASGGFGDMFSSIGSFSGSELGSLGSSFALGDVPLAFGFASGGYTGTGADSEPRGVVHANEFVVHADAVRRIGLPFLQSLNGQSPLTSKAQPTAFGATDKLPGFAGGGFTGPSLGGLGTILPFAGSTSTEGGTTGTPGTTPAPTGPATMNSAAAMLIQAAQALMQAAQALGGGGSGGGGGTGGALLSMGLGILGGGLLSQLGGKGGGAGGGLGGLLTGLLFPKSKVFGSPLSGITSGIMGGSSGSFSGASLAGLGTSFALGSSPLNLGFDNGGFTGAGGDHEPAGIVHKNEWVWDADTTRKYMPVLKMIGLGQLPAFQAPPLGQQLGRSGPSNLHVHFGDMHFPNVTDERTARASSNQLVSHTRRRLALVTRKGLNS